MLSYQTSCLASIHRCSWFWHCFVYFSVSCKYNFVNYNNTDWPQRWFFNSFRGMKAPKYFSIQIQSYGGSVLTVLMYFVLLHSPLTQPLIFYSPSVLVLLKLVTRCWGIICLCETLSSFIKIGSIQVNFSTVKPRFTNLIRSWRSFVNRNYFPHRN
jgi:hypothetical protein